MGECGQQLRDVLGILMVQGLTLDRVRIERWVEELGLQTRWAQVLEMERAERDSP